MPVTFTSKAGTTCSCEADDDGLARRISLDCFRAEWDFCPTTLAPQPESVSLAPMLPSWVVTRHDGCGHTVFTWDGGMGGTSCVYDSSTQQLIGARTTE